MIEFNLDRFLTEGETQLRLGHALRSIARPSGLRLKRDSLEEAECLFLRGDVAVRLRLDGTYILQRCAAGGWLLASRDRSTSSYWLPNSATLRRVSEQGHILEERATEPDSFDLDTTGVVMAFASTPEGWTLDAIIWRLNDPALIEELQTLAPIETQGYFLFGSHTRYDRPADLYRHLIHGWVYEDRYAWPHKRRICSENDAHALHLIFSGLHRTTGKRIYDLFKTQLLLSVLSRQSEDGGFRHGEWTEKMESHYRLHCSAMHLMMDTLSEVDEPIGRQALRQAATYLAKQTDDTNLGIWFLHDELEKSTDSMEHGPFNWVRSRAFGKSESNMLVLNTHLDASVAIARAGNQLGEDCYAELLSSAQAATRSLLDARPAEWLYRPLFWAIGQTLLPVEEAVRLPLVKRAIKRMAWKHLIPHLPDIKCRFPRIVMPGGYIDRELSLRTWAHPYLSINLMDLLRYRGYFLDTTLDDQIHQTARYTYDSGITKRWSELKYEKYALGFWAEALYRLCLMFPDSIEYRNWLAEAVHDLYRTGQGVPPSFLGANAEVIERDCQHPCPAAMDPDLRVANLCHGEQVEILVINPTSRPVKLVWHHAVSVPATVMDRNGKRVNRDYLTPHEWLRVVGAA